MTHGIGFLPQMDKIIVMKNGAISEIGTYSELIAKKGDFSDFIMDQLSQSREEEEEEDDEVWQSLEPALGAEQIRIRRQLSAEVKVKREKSHQRTSSLGSLSEASSVPVSLMKSSSSSASGATDFQVRTNTTLV